MKKDRRELMQDALGLLRDDFVADAQSVRSPAAHKRISWRMLLAASVAVLLAAGVCMGMILSRNPEPTEYSEHTESLEQDEHSQPPQYGQLYCVPNVWEREDFNSIAFLFQNDSLEPSLSHTAEGGFALLAGGNGGKQVIVAENLTVGQSVSVGLENLIAERYAVAYDEHFRPVFYDLEQNTVVDLDAQIIGDQRVSLEPLLEAFFDWAEKLYPGILSTQNNRDLLTKYVHGMSRDLVEWRLTWHTYEPDVEFLSQIDGFRYETEETLRIRLFEECFFEIHLRAYDELTDFYQHKPYRVEIMGMDGKNGACLAVVRDVIGNGLDHILYDFKTDSWVSLPRDRGNTLLGTMWAFGDAEFRFSDDGKVVSVVYPDAGYSGGNLKKSYLDRYTIEADRDLHWYKGERVGVFYLEHGTAFALPIRASGEAFLAESGNVVYYKQCQRVRTEQMHEEWGEELGPIAVKCPDELWYSRLYSPDTDTDQWVFTVLDPKVGATLARTTLQGKFVRFMADETVVLMEKEGIYTAYELKTGRDVTAEISSDTYGQDGYPYHERLMVYQEDGVLYQKDVFGVYDPVALAQADQYVLSRDGAFAFAYSSQTGKALCINVASGSSIEVELSDAFLLQLTQLKDAKLVISYNEYENTLLFSLSTQQKDMSGREKLALEFAETMLDP